MDYKNFNFIFPCFKQLRKHKREEDALINISINIEKLKKSNINNILFSQYLTIFDYYNIWKSNISII